MSNQMEYKCPACGGALAFDSASQQLKCPFCDSVYELDRFEQQPGSAPQAQPGEQDASGGMNWNEDPGSGWAAGETDDISVFSCNSCGGEIVCEDTTASATCPYCGNPVVFKGKLSGMLKPDCIIPFKLDKNQAKEALKRHVDRKKLVPALFKDKNHIDEIKGVYVPFWLFDAQIAANISYKGERTRTWSDAEYKYIEHNYYRIYRAGYVAFDQVPVDGSKKMADDLMESIEPFKISEAVDFQTAYLSGYLADKYDVSEKESINRAHDRMKKSAEEVLADTVKGYASVVPENTNVNISGGKAQYALYPVWILNTTWKDKKYIFAMNGQTGKMTGDLPIDRGIYLKWLAGLTAVFTVVLCLAGLLIF